MKRVLFLLLACVSLVAHSEQISGVWAFNIANIQGTYFRELLNEANQLQTELKFVPEHKPGAGGAVAAQNVKQRDDALLGTAAGFFVRPYLYPDTQYTFKDFRPVFVMAISPVALVSHKSDLQEVLKKDKISIGTAGAGSLTHLLALKFKAHHLQKDIQVIPYKSSTEALADVFGDHIDLVFEFLGDAEAKGAKVLGTTGTKAVKTYSRLTDLGYTDLGAVTGVYLILARSSMPVNKVQELRSLFTAAEKSSTVQELYRADYSSKPAHLVSQQDYDLWYANTLRLFQSLTAGVKVD